jgi:uncharacterized protein (TIGR03083 family)
MDSAEYGTQLDWLGAEIDRLADIVTPADPDLPVPTCPEWDLGELLVHVGTGHRWAAAMVDARTPTWLRPDELDLAVPGDRADLADWIRAGGTLSRTVYENAEASTPVWSWTEDHTAGFWLRRMVHETVVHRCDAAAAVGVRADIATDLAVDGIDEWLTILPALADAENLEVPAGDGDVLSFVATDADRSWQLGSAVAGATPAVTLAAPASELLQVLYRRLDPGPTHGDRTVLLRWLDASRF